MIGRKEAVYQDQERSPDGQSNALALASSQYFYMWIGNLKKGMWE